VYGRPLRLEGPSTGAFLVSLPPERGRLAVVLFDVGLPYICNWDFGVVLRMLPGGAGVPFVFTTANKAQLELLVGPTNAYELTGTPDNLHGLLALIHAAGGKS
jgi:hypothetical protein